ncbi:hypothetical protein BHOIPH791_14080 [Bartonella henselae]|nr:hypothetical protein BhenCHDE101_07390 [Bartonella henselae]PNM38979.1 hypothetical protein AL470_006705 [Bartonella henselae str. Houston-1]OLL44563.1 hypothetical protein AT242_07965 [Bartonella henselae]GFF02044.1 hypothetical protein BH623125_04780 [Bartonella henselae]GFF04451.1 hypothetical protein BH80429_12720 [Bartonella henselae]
MVFWGECLGGVDKGGSVYTGKRCSVSMGMRGLQGIDSAPMGMWARIHGGGSIAHNVAKVWK